MTDIKTKPTDEKVEAFLNRIADDERRADCFAVLALMQRATRAKPKMWGPAIVGFGDYRYKYDSGREGDWFLTGFSPRKQDLTLYLMGGLDRHTARLERLGKHKRGKSCLYIKRLRDVDVEVLREMLAATVEALKGKA